MSLRVHSEDLVTCSAFPGSKIEDWFEGWHLSELPPDEL